ncbi:MAG: redoxin domain-containing protein [Candidatus Margulisbacteria bacterium]|nr:redoxin domain-containing protein [Candidatus Margulisiibacteriota bacterium]
MRNSRTIILVVVIIIIAGSIYWLETKKTPRLTAKEVPIPPLASAKDSPYPRAKELAAPAGFVNTGPIAISQFIGKKVVLIDFMTYSCINCQRTYPYLNAWWDKYKDHGLEIIGIHSPEFDFEKKIGNVQAAAKRFGLKFPIVLDNAYGTWNAYGNLYWPHDYLIDIYGNIIHDQIGEGSYDRTEREIQKALQERKSALGLKGEAVPGGLVSPSNIFVTQASMIKSEETYFGSARNSFLASGIPGLSGVQAMPEVVSIRANSLYLVGRWDLQPQFAQNKTAGDKIIYRYSAKDVYLVANSDRRVKIRVLLDGQPLGGRAGADVGSDGTVTIKEDRLYRLIEDSVYGEHTLEIIIESPGLRVYTFTFG